MELHERCDRSPYLLPLRLPAVALRHESGAAAPAFDAVDFVDDEVAAVGAADGAADGSAVVAVDLVFASATVREVGYESLVDSQCRSFDKYVHHAVFDETVAEESWPDHSWLHNCSRPGDYQIGAELPRLLSVPSALLHSCDCNVHLLGLVGLVLFLFRQQLSDD